MQYTPRSHPTPNHHPNSPQSKHTMNKPLVPWIGGKRRLAKLILPHFGGEHECYVEPFAGAAALFFLKQPSPTEVINDINSDLVNLYRVVQNHLEEFVRQFKWSLVAREEFQRHLRTPPETLTDIQRAARFMYLQKLCFGGKVSSQTYGTATTGGARWNLLRVEEDLSAAHMRLAGVQIEHLPWDECVCRYDRPHTLFYCDPPYWETEGYGVEFPLEQYHLLAEMAASVKGRMVISVNDHPEMRKAFKGLIIERTELRYTVGGGAKATPPRGELIIHNQR